MDHWKKPYDAMLGVQQWAEHVMEERTAENMFHGKTPDSNESAATVAGADKA
jgi:hypothetical protein